MLEMLNAGLLEATVVDDWKAKMWAQVLPKVQIHENIQLRPPIKMGWAIRKDSPKLAAELNEFYAWYAKTAGGVPALQRQYVKTIKVLHNAASSEDQKRFRQLIAYFEKYGRQYHFDPIMGYAGKMLSGARAADPVIESAYCKEGEKLLGWISMGTPKGPAKPRGEIDPSLILSSF